MEPKTRDDNTLDEEAFFAPDPAQAEVTGEVAAEAEGAPVKKPRARKSTAKKKAAK